MSKEGVVVFGTGDFAELVHFYLTKDSNFKVVGFTVDKQTLKKDEFLGLPVVPFEGVEKIFPPDKFGMFIAIGYRDVNQVRARKYGEAKQKGYELIKYVCSKNVCWIDDKDIGDNTFIFENQTIQPFVKIGNNVVIWSGNHIGHSSNIGNHCYITSEVTISGHAVIGPYCFLGVDSSIRNGINIAKGCVIAQGAVVVKDTEEDGVYLGNPARFKCKTSELKRI